MKIKQIYTYREQNFYIDPQDKFRMARVGVGLKAELGAGDDPQESQEALDAKAQDLVTVQIERASAMFAQQQKNLVSAEDGMGAVDGTLTEVGDGGPKV